MIWMLIVLVFYINVLRNYEIGTVMLEENKNMFKFTSKNGVFRLKTEQVEQCGLLSLLRNSRVLVTIVGDEFYIYEGTPVSHYIYYLMTLPINVVVAFVSLFLKNKPFTFKRLFMMYFRPNAYLRPIYRADRDGKEYEKLCEITNSPELLV